MSPTHCNTTTNNLRLLALTLGLCLSVPALAQPTAVPPSNADPTPRAIANPPTRPT